MDSMILSLGWLGMICTAQRARSEHCARPAGSLRALGGSRKRSGFIAVAAMPARKPFSASS